MKQGRVFYILFTTLILQQHKTVQTLDIASFIKPLLNDNVMFAQNLQFLINTFLLGSRNNVEILKDTVNFSIPLLEADKNGSFLNYIVPWAFQKLPVIVGTEGFQELGKAFIEEVNVDSYLLTKLNLTKIVNGTTIYDIDKYLAVLNYSHMFSSMNDTNGIVDIVRDLYRDVDPLFTVDGHGVFRNYLLPWALKELPLIMGSVGFQELGKAFIEEVNVDSYLLTKLNLTKIVNGTTIYDVDKYLAVFNYSHMFSSMNDTNGIVDIVRDLYRDVDPLFTVDDHGVFRNYLLPWALKELPLIMGSVGFQELGKAFVKEVNADAALLRKPGLRQTVNGVDAIDINTFLSSLNFPRMFSSIKDTNSIVDKLRDLFISIVPLLAVDGHGVFRQYMLPWAMENLPSILGNKDVQKVLRIFVKEANFNADTLVQSDITFTVTDNETLFDSMDTSMLSNGSQHIDFPGLMASLNYPRILSKVKDELFEYNSTNKELSEQCYKDVMVFFDRLFLGEKAAVDMFDAIGKPTTGINKGVLYFIGSYDECLAVHIQSEDTSSGNATNSETIEFKGRYCRATFDPPRSLVEIIAGEHINNTYGIPLTLSWGMCLPDSCAGNDIEGLLNLGLLGKLFDITVKEAHCNEEQDFVGDTDAHIVVGILGGLLVLVIICSLLDLLFFKPSQPGTDPVSKLYDLDHIPMYDNSAFDGLNDTTAEKDGQPDGGHIEANDGHVDANKTPIRIRSLTTDSNQESNGFTAPGKLEMMDITMDSDLTVREEKMGQKQGRLVSLIRGFSIFTNIPSLMDTDTKPGDISCLYGIRVVSMMFIVLANTFMYAVLSVTEVPVSVNLMDSFNFMDRWTFQPILQASLDTDTFFLISGCLTCYWFLIKTKGVGRKLNGWLWVKFYVGRYWKMTPPYMLVMALFVYLYMYLGQGPMWPDKMAVAEKCKTDWWKHLIYINNLIGVDGIAAVDQCMPWSWYLAVNMQFYLIAPIFLSLMVYSSSMGLILLLIMGSAGIIAAGVKESEYGGDLLTSSTDQGAYWNNIFTKPWCRLAPFCVGMTLGFAIFRQRSTEKKMKKWLAALCWICTVLPAILVLYCQYTKHVDSIEPWTRTQDSVFEALSRPVWSIGIGWILFASCEGYAGPLGEFFSWPGFVPLSRLTFLVYLLHPIVIVLFTYTKRAMNNINDFEMIYLYIGHLVLSYAAAFIACLVIDLPFRNIRRVLQGKLINTPY